MFFLFFFELRKAGLKIGIRELLDLHALMAERLIFADMDAFYQLARCALVKDEREFARYDAAFSAFFHGIQALSMSSDIPEEWLRKNIDREFSAKEKAAIEKMGGMDELLKKLKERLAEQKERHEGGNKWVGTGGTSPFGNSGYHPNGIRIGGEGGNKQAARIWDANQYNHLDGDMRLGTRHVQMALRRLRRFARAGKEDEFDLNGTVAATARQGGWLQVEMRAQRRNKVKVLLFFDIGGSMDPHIKYCETLFSAAKQEFKSLRYFYFHNFIYESLWSDVNLDYEKQIDLDEIVRRYGPDYKAIFVGDASMSPYEITHSGGAHDQWMAEPGVQRFMDMRSHFKNSAWLNPLPQSHWQSIPSVAMISEIMEHKMYPVTADGLDECMNVLAG